MSLCTETDVRIIALYEYRTSLVVIVGDIYCTGTGAGLYLPCEEGVPI